MLAAAAARDEEREAEHQQPATARCAGRRAAVHVGVLRRWIGAAVMAVRRWIRIAGALARGELGEVVGAFEAEVREELVDEDEVGRDVVVADVLLAPGLRGAAEGGERRGGAVVVALGV